MQTRCRKTTRESRINRIKSETLKRGKQCNKKQTVCKAMDVNIAGNQTLDDRTGAEITCRQRDCIFRSSACVLLSCILATCCSPFFHVHQIFIFDSSPFCTISWHYKMTQNTGIGVWITQEGLCPPFSSYKHSKNAETLQKKTKTFCSGNSIPYIQGIFLYYSDDLEDTWRIIEVDIFPQHVKLSTEHWRLGPSHASGPTCHHSFGIYLVYPPVN